MGIDIKIQVEQEDRLLCGGRDRDSGVTLGLGERRKGKSLNRFDRE